MRFTKSFIAAALVFFGVVKGKAVVDPQLYEQLGLTGSADIFVRFPSFDFSSLKPGWNSFSEISASQDGFAARAARRQAVYDRLKEHAEATQADALVLMKNLGMNAESMWIDNSLYVQNAPADLIQVLSMVDNIQSIDMDKIIATIERPIMEDIEIERNFGNSSETTIEWNIKQINAHDSWKVVGGEGVTIANIDTGVMFKHEALVSAYRGKIEGKTDAFDHDYNWFDPKKLAKAPSDNNGHGTHTMGTMIGKTVKNYHIGVAPRAKWIAAKGCASFGCSTYDLTASAQFVLCPTKMDGKSADCSKGADVVSNSWGGGRGDSWFKRSVDAWREAGIIPVFSQGNSGPRCGSANSPADLDNVIGVGSSNKNFELSRFSSRGPGVTKANFSKQKPDITAPGELVVSSYTDGKYRALSGTSMAAPHVAGLVALLLSANPKLEYDDIYAILTGTAMKTQLKEPVGGIVTCEGISYDVFPNYFYGFGLIDSLPAVKKAKGGRKEGEEVHFEDDLSDLLRSLLRIGLNINM